MIERWSANWQEGSRRILKPNQFCNEMTGQWIWYWIWLLARLKYWSSSQRMTLTRTLLQPHQQMVLQISISRLGHLRVQKESSSCKRWQSLKESWSRKYSLVTKTSMATWCSLHASKYRPSNKLCKKEQNKASRKKRWLELSKTHLRVSQKT